MISRLRGPRAPRAVRFGVTFLAPARSSPAPVASTRSSDHIALSLPLHSSLSGHAVGVPFLHALSSRSDRPMSQWISAQLGASSPFAHGRRWRHTSSTVQDESGEWTVLPNSVRMQVLEHSDHDDRPVTHGQTVRIAYVARLDDGKECARAEASFRLGQGTVCEALEQGVVGMCVGDVRRLRASGYLRRGPALAAAPAGEMIEYQVQLTGAVHHMQIITIPRAGSDDPLQAIWDFSRRSILSVFGGNKPPKTTKKP